ncbi:MAG: hypothetical protein GX446_14040 [Chthonomonadales bacterium]|nr:hypothetical protein [Chthonomonadales bacterium]
MLAVVLCACALAGAAPAPAPPSAFSPQPSAFSTVGLYVWHDTPSQHAFWKACGINTLQFCDTHWSIRADLLEDYYRRFADGVANAARSGFRTDVILFSNIAQWEGPDEREPTGTGVLFDPRDERARNARLEAIRRAVRALNRADGFTLVAGDPGGAVRAPFGPLPASEWMSMARDVRRVVKREAPRARFSVNPWAIAYWQYPDMSCFTSAWWIREELLTRQVFDAPDLIGPDCGVQIPGHTYYRPLALRVLAEDRAGLAAAPFPDAADIRRLRERGAKRIWAWPYFLLDEADDGDVGPDGVQRPRVQIDTRYIRRCVSQMRAIGVDGIIGNWSYAGHLPKALNTFAFGRFCRDPRATPERVLDEYARLIADDASWRDLSQVFRFVEGLSNWERKLPPEHRLAPLACRLSTSKEAQAALRRVRPRADARFPFPEAPERFLERLAERLREAAPEADPAVGGRP